MRLLCGASASADNRVHHLHWAGIALEPCFKVLPVAVRVWELCLVHLLNALVPLSHRDTPIMSFLGPDVLSPQQLYLRPLNWPSFVAKLDANRRLQVDIH